MGESGVARRLRMDCRGDDASPLRCSRPTGLTFGVMSILGLLLYKLAGVHGGAILQNRYLAASVAGGGAHPAGPAARRPSGQRRAVELWRCAPGLNEAGRNLVPEALRFQRRARPSARPTASSCRRCRRRRGAHPARSGAASVHQQLLLAQRGRDLLGMAETHAAAGVRSRGRRRHRTSRRCGGPPPIRSSVSPVSSTALQIHPDAHVARTRSSSTRSRSRRTRVCRKHPQRWPARRGAKPHPARRIAFGVWIPFDSIMRVGIERVTRRNCCWPGCSAVR